MRLSGACRYCASVREHVAQAMADEGIATSTSRAWHDAQLQLAAQRHAVYVKTPDEVTASVAWLAGCVSAWKRGSRCCFARRYAALATVTFTLQPGTSAARYGAAVPACLQLNDQRSMYAACAPQAVAGVQSAVLTRACGWHAWAGHGVGRCLWGNRLCFLWTAPT